jgi:hypothetical protein
VGAAGKAETRAPETGAVSFDRQNDLKGDLFAVVVGISKYSNPNVNPLKLAAKDAESFAKFVREQAEFYKKVHLTVICDEQATREKVESCLLYELGAASEKDSVILYFSGHGAIDPIRPGEFYFLTYDANPDRPAATAVLMDAPRLLGGLKARLKLVILDACHAGAFANTQVRTRDTGEPLKRLLKQFQESTGQAILSASQPNQFALELSNLPNGVFTHFLLEGLRGKADKHNEGVVTVQQAYDYAFEKTKTATGGAQTPQLSGQLTGPFPVSFIRPQGGVLELVTDPPEVNVYAKDSSKSGFRFLNKTDNSGLLVIKELPLGESLIFRLTRDGWQDAITDPVVLSAEKRELKLGEKLTPRKGHLTVITNAPKVSVRVDENSKGETDDSNFLFVEDVQVGVPHELCLTKEDYLEKKIALTIPVSYENRVYQVHETLVALRKPAPPPTPISAPAPPKLKTTDLAFNTQPGEVSVIIDGEYKGATDPKGELTVRGLSAEKTAKVLFKKFGYVSVEKSVLPAGSDSIRVDPVVLNRLATRVEVSAAPPFADVYIKHGTDFQPAAKTDGAGVAVIDDLPLEKNIYIKIKKEGWKEKRFDPVKLTEDKPETKLTKISLEPALTTVKMQVDPPGSTVKVDGVEKASSTGGGLVTLSNVQVAVDMEIELTKEGYQPKYVNVSVPTDYEGRIFKLDPLKLDRATATVTLSTNLPDIAVLVDGKLVGATDKDGAALLQGIPVGVPVEMHFQKEGHVKRSLIVTVPAESRGGTFNWPAVVNLEKQEQKVEKQEQKPQKQEQKVEKQEQKPPKQAALPRPAASSDGSREPVVRSGGRSMGTEAGKEDGVKSEEDPDVAELSAKSGRRHRWPGSKFYDSK